jgi:hypothetical protein
VIYARIAVANNFFTYFGYSVFVVLGLTVMNFYQTQKGYLFLNQVIENRIVQSWMIGLIVFVFFITSYMFQPFSKLR